jgi:NTP pyrophosphatase (non-canonical NTP hydrolase)
VKKSLKEMEAEVEEYCRDKGWYDTEVPFAVAMALLHEEVAEAGHAWRQWGLTDQTVFVRLSDRTVVEDLAAVEPADLVEKPEGVGSEFADILIRLLDGTARYKIDLGEYLEDDPDIFELDENFLVNICTLHGLIAGVITATATQYESAEMALATVLAFLLQMCRHYGIDLDAEYTRKMAYNRTRAYRHGNRRY